MTATTVPARPEPLPCPFCGGVGLDFNEDGSTFRWARADCSNCGASTGEVRKHAGWKTDAIAAWNRRSTPDARVAERYQFLVNAAGPHQLIALYTDYFRDHRRADTPPTKESVDAAIDAAIAATKEKM